METTRITSVVDVPHAVNKIVISAVVILHTLDKEAHARLKKSKV